MAEEAAAGGAVGSAAAVGRFLDDNEVLPGWLTDPNPKVVEAAQGFARTRFDKESWPLINSFQTSGWTARQVTNLALALPFDKSTWDFVKAHGPESEDRYWTAAWGYNRTLSSDEHERPILEWLARKRPAPALNALSLILDGQMFSPQVVFETLESFFANASASETNAEVGWGGHRIGKLIKYLQNDPVNDKTRLLVLEWRFLPLLLSSGESPQTLFATLASEPAFFVEILSFVCRRDDEPKRNDLTKQEETRLHLGRQLLDAWRIIPGSRTDGSIDEAVFRRWGGSSRRGQGQEVSGLRGL